MAISVGELLNKIQLDEKRVQRYKVHDNEGNKKWEQNISNALSRCSWMASREDLLSYIDYIKDKYETDN